MGFSKMLRFSVAKVLRFFATNSRISTNHSGFEYQFLKLKGIFLLHLVFSRNEKSPQEARQRLAILRMELLMEISRSSK